MDFTIYAFGMVSANINKETYVFVWILFKKLLQIFFKSVDSKVKEILNKFLLITHRFFKGGD